MRFIISFFHITYKYFLRKIIFFFDAERVHDFFTSFGNNVGKATLIRNFLKLIFVKKYSLLWQNIAGINFESPIGLAAGFDYKAKLMNILSSIGFGFETIGTITNSAYEGNAFPRLGRLPKSRSLLVNKGFKNEGIKKVSKRLKTNFEIPIGLSIGKTNTETLNTQKKGIKDVISAFRIAEKAKINISYYELNISCPNLCGNIDFYEPIKLEELLKQIFSLNLSKPIFIKMPISKTNEEIIKMMRVIIKFPVAGVIFGNLQKDRNNDFLVKSELKKYPVGNFSGKPTEERSNELIKLAYKNFGNRLIIIGCGGVFNAKDAYTKIKLGASLVQLITGLVFEGPQLVSGINYELNKMIKKDGFTNISQAVGSAS